VCPSCGARNSSNSSRCWQCQAVLIADTPAVHVTPPRQKTSRLRPAFNAQALERRLTYVSLSVVVLAIVLSVQLLHGAQAAENTPATTLAHVYDHYLPATRVMAGAILVFLWPTILHGSARMLHLRFPCPGRFLTLLGVLLGGSAYCLTFLPWPGPALALLVPPVIALGLFLRILRLSPRRGIPFFLLQGALSFCVAATVIWALESTAAGRILNPVREIPVIYRTASEPPHEPFQANDGGILRQFSCPTSGSAWLDYRANRAQARVLLQDSAGNWTLSVHAGTTRAALVSTGSVDESARTELFTPLPDTVYLLRIEPTILRAESAVIESLLPLRREDGAG
jgi:hypothetical protein